MIICHSNLNDLRRQEDFEFCENFIKVRDVLFLLTDIDRKEFPFGI